MIHPGSASPPFPPVRLLSDGCPAALPPIPAAAGRHLGLSLRCESTRETLKLRVPQPTWGGGSELLVCTGWHSSLVWEGEVIATKLLSGLRAQP